MLTLLVSLALTSGPILQHLPSCSGNPFASRTKVRTWSGPYFMDPLCSGSPVVFRITNGIVTAGPAISDLRASTATHFTNRVLSTAASNTTRVELLPDGGGGILIEGPGANTALQSVDMSNAAWTPQAGTTLTGASGSFLDGTNTMTSVAVGAIGVAAGGEYQLDTVPSSTGPWTMSAYVAAASGTVQVSVAPTLNAAQVISTCTCGTSDPTVSCAALITNTSRTCQATATVGLATTRVWATFTASTAQTGVYAQIWPGTYLASASLSVLAAGAQLEAQGWPSSYIPTLSTAVARAADRITATSSFTLPPTAMSMAADVLIFGANASGFNTYLGISQDTNNNYQHYSVQPPNVQSDIVALFAGVGHSEVNANTIAVGTQMHTVAKYDGVNLYSCANGICGALPLSASGAMTIGTILIGDNLASPGTYALNGYLKNACVANTPLGCP